MGYSGAEDRPDRAALWSQRFRQHHDGRERGIGCRLRIYYADRGDRALDSDGRLPTDASHHTVPTSAAGCAAGVSSAREPVFVSDTLLGFEEKPKGGLVCPNAFLLRWA